MAKTGLTEREIIGILKRRFASGPKLPLGFDDDVAAFPMSQGRLVVLKTDMLVGSTDVPRGMTLGQAARKAVVATVRDLGANGVQPRVRLVSLCMAAVVRLSSEKEIASGLKCGSSKFGSTVLGGDTW